MLSLCWLIKHVGGDIETPDDMYRPTYKEVYLCRNVDLECFPVIGMEVIVGKIRELITGITVDTNKSLVYCYTLAVKPSEDYADHNGVPTGMPEEDFDKVVKDLMDEGWEEGNEV